MSVIDSRFDMTGTSIRFLEDLSPGAGEQIGQRSTLSFGDAARSVIKSSLRTRQRNLRPGRREAHLHGRRIDSEQSKSCKDGPQVSAKDVMTATGSWRSQQSLKGSIGIESVTMDKFKKCRTTSARSP